MYCIHKWIHSASPPLASARRPLPLDGSILLSQCKSMAACAAATSRQVFISSDTIHSKELASVDTHINSTWCDTATSQSDGLHVVVCYKDGTSLYKSTRKVSRTAKRLSSIFFSSDSFVEGRTCDVCDGYWIASGGGQPSTKDGNITAIPKRLATEFKATEHFKVSLDMNDINQEVCITKLSTDSTNTLETTILNVIFLDLDKLAQSCIPTIPFDEHPSVTTKLYSGLLDSVISSLIRQPYFIGRNAVIHVKSEQLYRVIASAYPSNQCYVERVEFDRYVKSKLKEDDTEPKDNRSSGNIIRRLRQNKGAAHCPLSMYPARYVELPCAAGARESLIEICRFHNYDSERGCLRSKKAEMNPDLKGCDMTHNHCHSCGAKGHKAFQCALHLDTQQSRQQSLVFRLTSHGSIRSIPFHGYLANNSNNQNGDEHATIPALIVLAGRLRGRTLAACEMLPLISSPNNDSSTKQRWKALPNLLDHRGSHAACSPVGSGLAFVMGGGGVDGNLDTVEIINFHDKDVKWQTMTGRLSSPRHAFEAVACVTKNGASLFAVGGWKYGKVSCESVDKLTFEFSCTEGKQPSVDVQYLQNEARWTLCAPLLTPRRLHSVVASADGATIFVFGGYVDERNTTQSIEKYDISLNTWTAWDGLPYGETNCPLVQAVVDWNVSKIGRNEFLVFPFGEGNVVLRYSPETEQRFSPVMASSEKHLCLPIANWASFSATSSPSLNKAFLIGGTIDGKWTDRGFELDLDTLEWRELPPVSCARRRLASVVLE